MPTVLLTDALMRKTLSASRSLGMKGVKVIVADTTRCTPAAFSRYSARTVIYPDPVQQPEKFMNWLVQTLRSYSVDVLIPMDDTTMSLAVKHRKELESLCAMVLPPSESYEHAEDKYASVQLAASAGLACPATYMPQSLGELDELAGELAYPVIIKPRRSSGSRGIRLVGGKSELKHQYRLIHEQYPFPLVQEYIPAGERIDVCLLFNHRSELRSAFVQKELRHYPVERGPSTAQESIRCPELVKACSMLLQSIGWSGIAELEFMIDPRDGRPKFMEINPRFWNSLHLAVLSGIDFPWLLYQAAVNGDAPDRFEYTEGIKCRSLLPGDVLHLLTNREPLRLLPNFFSGPAEGGRDDILSLHDPGPVIGFVAACLRYAFDLRMWRTMFMR
ncbi:MULTISPECIES: ATP-grasp domain-containing protein [unclassified Paenibacillus]|uniref:carboxylate--amine ligase n=1 Tax=unclassified Paenibacillus TaxID=185978 RepID=UPI001AE14DA9|nr:MULTISPECIES: ATP-grasp domain-containing protein [unclassified Paenibacillus]MBP1154245.1 putative ATP-grasp superfamily ATP-dependent carboligase [Paenibacillus sp. PvP091]MBP1170370.1 putative ATP-grasp superfamily ATP-dependent carboligase [Paenibacillus sp. PvR098]MBP2441398.1 putative ATP-grasp superfamily ATP-dependent carboligase [Paenibacillus sp. PvP052]